MATERSASTTLQTNERIKHFAGAVTAWGNALLIATFGKWALVGFDPFVLLWLVIALCLIWAASRALTMLEVERHDD
jgi:fatty acid desaturase